MWRLWHIKIYHSEQVKEAETAVSVAQKALEAQLAKLDKAEREKAQAEIMKRERRSHHSLIRINLSETDVNLHCIWR